MTDANPNDLRMKPAEPRRNVPNVSGAWIVMLLAGLIAVVIFLFATQKSSQTFSVAVMSERAVDGQPIKASSLRAVNVSVPKNQLSKMVLFDDRNSVDGWLAVAPLESGDIVLRSTIRKPATEDRKRAMSIPIKMERAVNGEIVAGDRVDVVDVGLKNPQVKLVPDLKVLSVNRSGGGGALAGGSSFGVTVAVTPEEAILLSEVLNRSQFDVVRSTGAVPVSPSTSGAIGGTLGTA